MSIYTEQLKDPRWEKMRRSIIKRDKFICRACCANHKELHVHHLVYFKGLAPWEYSKMYLVTLCHECHEATHNGKVLVLMPRTMREAGTNLRRRRAKMRGEQ